MMNLKNSQNFLNDKNLVEYLVRNSSINSDEYRIRNRNLEKEIINNYAAKLCWRVYSS